MYKSRENSDCQSFYIGQTGRSFKSRFREHIQALKSNNSTTLKSNFAVHLLTQNHTYKNIEENLNIIEILHKSQLMNSKKDPQNILNNQILSENSIFKILNQLQHNA